MTEIRTFPNVFWIAINVVITLFFFSLTVFLTSVYLKDKNSVILFPIFFLFFFSVLFFYQLSNHFVYISKDEHGITITQPLKFKIVKLDWGQIRGYSISEVWFGKNLHSSKSFVIYTIDKKIFEIIKICNFRFDKMLLSFDNNKIPNLGYEPYQTGVYKRKYKYT
ncbi:hypothetical protein LZZ90_10795 [Flavobacterium sp. SM15]|uniref:hypothetical protein n=1 Tax=Flavobacterium sp. SM15 TaxID=2908005 RepID=UPI001EDA7848|nr:hypothetical protein [Flavobacterium sp. SM15]MCG2611994.1 hypothetical protein [Flavobacterium sp. SM15]